MTTMPLEHARAEYVRRVDPNVTADPEWHDGLYAVPREWFAPVFFEPSPTDPGWRAVCAPEEEWARGVLSDRPLITHLNGSDRAPRPGATVHPTTAGTRPSLLLHMLHTLGVREGQMVLDVGTGTGYGAALLCHRLGPTNVTSVDADPLVVSHAQRRLDWLGYRPVLVPGDGRTAAAERGPYDRILVTVAMPGVPPELVAQTRDDGRILLPLDTRGAGLALVLLAVRGDTASGYVLSTPAPFLPLRGQTGRENAALTVLHTDPAEDQARETTVPHTVATETSHPFQLFAALRTGGYDHVGRLSDDGSASEGWIATPDGSWVCHTATGDGRYHVRQGGPHRLWDWIEALYDEWCELGQPARERFGLTVNPEAHVLWLDEPDGPNWLL